MLINQANNLNAFDKLADGYNKYRVDYPRIVIKILELYLAQADSSTDEKPAILDIGCGTGISTRLIFDYFGDRYNVIGLDPSEPMLNTALQYSDKSPINYINGRAENLPFNDCTVKCITAAQSIQWLDRPLFYREAVRVLEMNGTLCIMQNNRKWEHSVFLDEYESLLEKYNEQYNRGYRDINFRSEIKDTGKFTHPLFVDYLWSNNLSFDEFFGLSTSSTKVNKIINRIGDVSYKQLLQELFNKHKNEDEEVVITYSTEMFLFRKS